MVSPSARKRKVIRYPDRFMDEDRGRRFWNEVMSLLTACRVDHPEHGRASVRPLTARVSILVYTPWSVCKYGLYH